MTLRRYSSLMVTQSASWGFVVPGSPGKDRDVTNFGRRGVLYTPRVATRAYAIRPYGNFSTEMDNNARSTYPDISAPTPQCAVLP
jgi:hypothetical protein